MTVTEWHLVWYALGIFAAAALGGVLPLLREWRSNQLHLFVAFGAGVFLGAVFIHMLPEVDRRSPGLANGMVLVGFLVLLLLERVLLHRHSLDCGEGCPHRHKILGITSFVGLSVHSLTAGFSLGVALLTPGLAAIIFVAIIAHKATAAFSLSTIFVLAGFRPAAVLAMLGIFALMTPLGALISIPLIHVMKEISVSVPTALAAGTFLYVATMDLLPESFHDGEGRLLPFMIIILGVAAMYAIGRFGL